MSFPDFPRLVLLPGLCVGSKPSLTSKWCVCVCVIHSRAQTVCSIYYISNGANISPKTMSKNGEIFFGARRVRASLLCTFGFWHSIFGILAAFHLYLWEWCKPVAFWTNVIITGRHSFGGFFSSFIDQLLWWAFVFGRHQLLKWIGLLCDRLYLAMLTQRRKLYQAPGVIFISKVKLPTEFHMTPVYTSRTFP